MRVSIGKSFRLSTSARRRYCEHVPSDSEVSASSSSSSSCRQQVYVVCPHCQRSLCLYHINEHQLVIRSLLDSLVNTLNEQRYELTTSLPIASQNQSLVDKCLGEFKDSIIPFVQRTSSQNGVKQDDINRIQIFLDKMRTTIEHVQRQQDICTLTIIEDDDDDDELLTINGKRSRNSRETDDPDYNPSASKRSRKHSRKTTSTVE